MFRKFLAPAGLLLATAIWGSAFLVVKDSLSEINAITLVTYRFLLATAIFGIIVFFRKDNIKKSWFQGFILGVIIFLQLSLQALGLKYTSAANSAFITGLFVAFVPLLGIVFFKRIPTITQFLSLGIALIGLWLLTGGLMSFNYGDGLTLINALLNGLYIVMVDKIVKGKADPFVLNLQQFLTVGVLGLLTIFSFHLPTTVTSTYAIGSIIYLAVFATVISFGLVLIAQKYTAPVTAGIVLSTELVFGAIFAWTIGHETTSPYQFIGGGIIFLAIIISELQIDKLIYKKIYQKVKIEF